MIPVAELLLVSPIVGVAVAASIALTRGRLPRWLDIIVVIVTAFIPLAVFDRTPAGQSTGRALWEWSAAGGPVVQAAYHVDQLAVIGASLVALVSGVLLHMLSRQRGAPALLIALVAVSAIALVALVSVTDVVAGALVTGMAAALAVAIGLFVATASAAARLAALLALGVESFIAAALLLARFGIATFDLAQVPPDAITPGVLTAMTLGAALFCGLYPFVPWRYEPGAGVPLAALRGIALFPTGIAGSVLALRLIAATGAPATELQLPEIPLAWRAGFILTVLAVTALAIRLGPPEARLRRAMTGGAFLILALVPASLRWSHVVALLALLTVMYAGVASAAVVEEWHVARFDARLGVLWAAIASGMPLALAGALFGLIGSALALALETAPLSHAARPSAATGSRVLVMFGPFIALVGLAGTPDPIVAGLSGVAIGSAALLELGHAAREARREVTPAPRQRAYAALAALAAIAVVALISGAPIASAASSVFSVASTGWSDLALVLLGLLALALTVVVVAMPQVAAVKISPRVTAAVRRVLAATDPAPALALAYRGLEVWSRRIGAGSAALEDRAGVWVATLLIALTLLWAATS